MTVLHQPRSKQVKSVRIDILTAAACALAVLLAPRFLIPPGYAAALWAPSGIALAALLIRGNRTLPWIIAGTFAGSIGVDAAAALPLNWVPTLVHAGLDALATASQAAIGVFLVRRFRAFPNDFAEPRAIAVFLSTGGLVAGALGATLSIGGRWSLGQPYDFGIGGAWTGVWIADVMGVILFTPAIIVLWNTGLPPWRNDRFKRLLIVLTMTTAATLGITRYALHLEMRNLSLRLDEMGETLGDSLSHSVHAQFAVTESVAALMSADGSISLPQFHRFAEHIRAQTDSIAVLEWMPRVPVSRVASFEAWARAKGLDGFTVHPAIEPAQSRNDLYPVTYIEPTEGNRQAEGYDLGSEANRLAAITRAIDTGDPSITERITLVQDGKPATIAVIPVFDKTLPTATIQQRRTAFIGSALGVIRLHDLILDAFSGADMSLVHFRLSDDTDPAHPTPLDQSEQYPGASSSPDSLSIPSVAFPLEAGGRVWLLETTPTKAFFARTPSNVGWLALLGGIALSGIAAAFVLVAGGREQSLINLLDQRRRELAQSEERYSSIFSEALAAMLLVEPETGTILDANRAARAFYGYDLDRLKAMTLSALEDNPGPRPTHALRDGGHFHRTHRLSDDSIRNVEIHAAPITIANRLLVYLIVHDETERVRSNQQRVRAQEVIQTLNLRLRQVLAAASETAIIATDTDGIITLFNRGAERMLGYHDSEVVEVLPVKTLIVQTSKVTYPDSSSPVTLDGDHQEAVLRTKSGTLVTVSVVVTHILNEADERIGDLYVAQDVTQWKLTESRLADSEARFRELVEATTDWVWETDENYRFSWLSVSFETVTGIPIRSVLGETRWDFASNNHDIDGARWTSHIEDLRNHRQFRDFRYWIDTPDGNARWVSVSGAPHYDIDGKFIGYRGSASDITSDAALAIRLRTLSAVVDQSPISVLISAPNGAITYVNAHHAVATGYAASEVIGQFPIMFKHPETPDALYDTLGEAVASGRTWSGELKNLRKDGSEHWVFQVMFPVTNDAGEIVHYVTICEDIGYRKESEAKLLEQIEMIQHQHASLRILSDIAALNEGDSAARLRQGLAMGAAHLGLDAGMIIRANERTVSIFKLAGTAADGLSEGTTIDRNAALCEAVMQRGDVLTVTDLGQSEFAESFARQHFGMTSYVGTPVYVRGDLWGTVSFWSNQGRDRAFDTADQEFVRLLARWTSVVIDRELSEQDIQSALASAREAQRHTELILASAGEGICGVDRDGRVIFVNPAARALLNWPDGEGIGWKMHEHMHHHHEDGSAFPVEDCPTTKTIQDGQARHIPHDTFWRLDGTPVPVETSIAPIIDDGQVTGAVTVFSDISQRLQNERVLASTHAELEQFAYVASHDLRQPLRVVSSYLKLIERALAASLSDDLKQYFGFAVDGAKRMDRLIMDLLDYSRTGKSATPPQRVDLSATVAESLHNLQIEIADAQATISVESGLPSIDGYPTELTRLFQNLIGNAIKYRAPGIAPEVSIGSRTDGKDLIVWVRDNGIGIAPEHQDRAFRIFQRLVPKEAYEGTGIGLAVCRKIIDHHGGRIWIDSQLGHGCTFLAAFPNPTV